MMDDDNNNVYPENLPFLERLNVCWDFDSQIKSLWLTGYVLITWEFDGDWGMFFRTLEWEWHEGGSYE